MASSTVRSTAGSAILAPAAPLVMPKLGLTMSEGLLAAWHVAPGDEVEAGQVLFMVETDKITSEIEAPAAGRILEVLVEAGETVEVGRPIALWTGPAQGSPERPERDAANTSETPSSQLEAEARLGGVRLLSTPLARRLAGAAGLALDAVVGTGPRGRIQSEDVRVALEQRSVPPPRSPPASPRPAPGPGRDLRALIAARVTRSKAEIPHFYLSADADLGALERLRQQLNADPQAPRRISVTALLILAAGKALQRRPEANVVWRDGRTQPLDSFAVGVAVDTPAGVVAPVIPVAGGLYQVAEALEAAAGRARAGRLGAGDVGEAALGLSNVGMFAVRALTPIIDPDQTFMLGVGAPRATFRPNDDGAPMAVREATLSLACDHRAIDGAPAARFLAAIVEGLEHPLRLLV